MSVAVSCWPRAAGYTAERDLLLSHIDGEVSGRTVFVTGDTHWTMAHDSDRLFEARPCPLGIPTPNDITLTQPQAAEDARAIPASSTPTTTTWRSWPLADAAASRAWS
ncbi:MAG: hypothetical protein ABIO51_02900 [Solirubrobacteraceae bacterium]